MLSPELESAIRQALDDATRRGHEFSALEHLLLALLDDEKTADVIRHCGGQIPRLSAKLEQFLNDEIKPLAVNPSAGVAGDAAGRGIATGTKRISAPRARTSGPSRRWGSRASSSAPSTTCWGRGGARPRAPTCWWRCSPSPSRTRSRS